MLAVTIDFIVFQAFFNNSQSDALYNFTGHQNETDRPVITLDSSFLPFWKMGTMFASFQLTETSPYSQIIEKRIVRGVEMTSSTLECIPLGHIDLLLLLEQEILHKFRISCEFIMKEKGNLGKDLLGAYSNFFLLWSKQDKSYLSWINRLSGSCQPQGRFFFFTY